MTTIVPVIDAAHGGRGWQERISSFKEELSKTWKLCGVDSECGKLKTIILHRPGEEINNITDPASVHWNAIIDLKKARAQHDYLADLYRQHDVEVLYLEPGNEASPNHFFMRDLFVMTPQGAVLARPASATRAGEEVAVYRRLAQFKIPILLTIAGKGVFEGPDVVFADKELAFVATGLRSNQNGAAQVKWVLEQQGIQVIDVQTTYGCGHLDGVMNLVDKRKAVLYPTRVSYVVYENLKKLGYVIIELPDAYEAAQLMAINMVAIAPGIVLMPSGCVKTAKCLQQNSIQVIPVDVSELMKGGGAIHCMTGVIWRDSCW